MKLIILDRDGVINEDSDHYIRSPEEWIPIPGSLEAIALFNQRGYTVSVASNQSGIARGYFSEQTLQDIHQKMHEALLPFGGKIDSIFYCPHHPTQGCACRKPKPGLLHQIASYYQTSLEDVPFVGDALRDIETAYAAKAKPILVLTGKGKKTYQEAKPSFSSNMIFNDLLSYATAFLNIDHQPRS